MAHTILHKADSRGSADHGWLQTKQTFSFANYHDPERMHFGVLRVLNDDVIAGGKGFGTHPHDNMEIISIPLEGALAHKDSIGNSAIIKKGDIQVMSAGTGIQHSEYNSSEVEEGKFLQIWLFPNKRNVTPRQMQMMKVFGFTKTLGFTWLILIKALL
jgi:redox-sensitive bicupin YhaK (pirin superfamily)